MTAAIYLMLRMSRASGSRRQQMPDYRLHSVWKNGVRLGDSLAFPVFIFSFFFFFFVGFTYSLFIGIYIQSIQQLGTTLPDNWTTVTIHLGGNIVPSINPLFNTISHVRLWLSESVVRNGITNNPYTAAPLKPYSIVRKGVHLIIYCGNLLSCCRSPPVVDYLLRLWIFWHPLPVVDYLVPLWIIWHPLPVVDYLVQLWIIWHPLPVVDYLVHCGLSGVLFQLWII